MASGRRSEGSREPNDPLDCRPLATVEPAVVTSVEATVRPAHEAETEDREVSDFVQGNAVKAKHLGMRLDYKWLHRLDCGHTVVRRRRAEPFTEVVCDDCTEGQVRLTPGEARHFGRQYGRAMAMVAVLSRAHVLTDQEVAAGLLAAHPRWRLPAKARSWRPREPGLMRLWDRAFDRAGRRLLADIARFGTPEDDSYVSDYLDKSDFVDCTRESVDEMIYALEAPRG